MADDSTPSALYLAAQRAAADDFVLMDVESSAHDGLTLAERAKLERDRRRQNNEVTAIPKSHTFSRSSRAELEKMMELVIHPYAALVATETQEPEELLRIKGEERVSAENFEVNAKRPCTNERRLLQEEGIARRPHGTRRSQESQTVLMYIEFAGTERYRLALADSSKDGGKPFTIKAWVCYQHPPPVQPCSNDPGRVNDFDGQTFVMEPSKFSVEVSKLSVDQPCTYHPFSATHATGGSHLLA